ncbi:MAG: hypothetical protein AAF962_27860 [Actinomycetota bacterium]
MTDHAQILAMPLRYPPPAGAFPVAPRPPDMINAAGVCAWCNEIGCDLPLCHQLHAAVTWTAHEQCGGQGCRGCWNGVQPGRLGWDRGIDLWAVVRLDTVLSGNVAICWCDEVGCTSPDCGPGVAPSPNWFGAHPESLWRKPGAEAGQKAA